MCNLYHRFSGSVQLFLLRYYNCLFAPFLFFFYFIDLVNYSKGPIEFLEGRAKIFGQNYAALGRIIVGEYEKTKEIIASPQKRGTYLGRAKIVKKYFPKHFLLFLSDEGAGGSGLHKTLHDYVWTTFIPPAMERVTTDPVFHEYIVEFLEKIGAAFTINSKTKLQDVEGEVNKFVVKYIYHAIFGAPLNENQVDHGVVLFLENQYFHTSAKPLHVLFCCKKGDTAKRFSELVECAVESPAMKDLFASSEENANISKEEMAELMTSVAGIAGFAGVRNLVLELLRIKTDFSIDFDNQMDVLSVILEAARLRSPVNNVNVITTEATKMTVHKKTKTLPKGTVMGASIGLAMKDPGVFKNPEKFDHKRENLIQASLNFNSVGFSPEGSGTRQCPGRNIAVHLATDLLKTRVDLS